jgi:hypothetical protein
MGQFVAQHGDGGGNAARKARSEGRPDSHTVHEDVHALAHQDHHAQRVLATLKIIVLVIKLF